MQGFQGVFHPNQEAPFSAIATTNGTPKSHLQPRPNHSMAHSNNQNPQLARGPRRVTQFDDFFEVVYLSRAQDYPNCHSQDDLVALAQRAWQEMSDSEREPWRVRYEHREAHFHETMAEMATRGSRERLRNMDARETRDVEMEEQGGGGGSGAGFTAVNG